MVKSILLFAVASLAYTTLHAEDIRYIYCKAEFSSASNSIPDDKIDRADQYVLFSPIFKIDVHDKATYNSRVDFVNQFISAVYDDAKKGKAHPYISQNHAARFEGCNLESSNLEDAKKLYDKDYVKERTYTQPHSGNRCSNIGTYNWKPTNLNPLYPNKVSTYSYNAYGQSCKFGSDTPRYKD